MARAGCRGQNSADVGNAPAASNEYFDRLEYDSGRFFIRPHLLTFAAFTTP
jgi:guanylate kinase